MTIGAIVQARLGSTRLPGKMLAPLAGRPVLAWVLERLAHAREPAMSVVATSELAADDAIDEFCSERGVRCHRGSSEDVAQRLLDAAAAAGLDAFVRVNGDSPLIDQRLIDRGAELMRAGGADLVTNVRPRTFPPGQSVEVVLTEALERALRGSATDEDREHVTGPLYRDGFSIVRFANDPPQTTPRYTLDTPADHARLEAILLRMDRPHWEYGWDELP